VPYHKVATPLLSLTPLLYIVPLARYKIFTAAAAAAAVAEAENAAGRLPKILQLVVVGHHRHHRPSASALNSRPAAAANYHFNTDLRAYPGCP